ncbi:MAG TPA: NAD(P)H-hydrate epimerase [Candidatus Dormibacteraeota bacterium]
MSSALPTLTSKQVQEVDALAQERFGISVEWLMEAAGWQVARFVRQRAAVVCGVGNNAGDGLAAARHLDRWGRLASVSCVDAGRLRGPAARELDALRRLGVEVASDLELEDAEVIVDAIFGTGLSRAPEGRFAEWIEAINGSGKNVISVDVPSGLDADTGVAYAPVVKASATITLGLPKPGLQKLPGRVFVADIGVPLEAYASVGVKVPADLFAGGGLIPL